jgi:hypothetical protein
MAFTFDPSTDIGRVRLRLDDREADRAAFTDAEIQAAITDEGGWRSALVTLARVLYMRLARRARDYSSPDGTTVNETAALDHLRQIMESAATEAAAESPSTALPTVLVGTMGRAPNDPWYGVS